MTTQQTPPTHATGRSRFAERGQSHEERMHDDDSATKFGEDGMPSSAAPEGVEREGLEREGLELVDGGAYGSGGSYGYGGAFEHGGQRGYQVSFQGRAAAENEEPYEATGSFGHDTEGYDREGVGHARKDEKRPAREVRGDAPDPRRSPAGGAPRKR